MITLMGEKEIAENLIKNFKEINFDTYKKLQCYTKYLKNETEKSKNEIRNEIDSIMMKYYSGFVMADWEKTLQSIVNKYTKPQNRGYKEATEVIIHKEELEFIKNIGDIGCVKDIEIEKVLFIMLVLGKINGFNQKKELWINEKSLTIFKLARFKYKQKSDKQKIQRERLIYDLANFKNGDILSTTTFGKSTGIKLLFPKKEGEEIIKINKDTDIENIVVQYLNWRDKEDFDYCSVCGKEIMDTNGKTNYCKICAINVKKENDKIRIKEQRLNL